MWRARVAALPVGLHQQRVWRGCCAAKQTVACRGHAEWHQQQLMATSLVRNAVSCSAEALEQGKTAGKHAMRGLCPATAHALATISYHAGSLHTKHRGSPGQPSRRRLTLQQAQARSPSAAPPPGSWPQPAGCAQSLPPAAGHRGPWLAWQAQLQALCPPCQSTRQPGAAQQPLEQLVAFWQGWERRW